MSSAARFTEPAQVRSVLLNHSINQAWLQILLTVQAHIVCSAVNPTELNGTYSQAVDIELKP